MLIFKVDVMEENHNIQSLKSNISIAELCRKHGIWVTLRIWHWHMHSGGAND